VGANLQQDFLLNKFFRKKKIIFVHKILPA